MAQVSRRHHHVTRHILRKFAEGDGMLRMHERGAGARRVKVEDAAVVKDLYSRGVPGGPKDDTIEKWLADHVDGPGSAVVDRILATDSLNLTNEQRIHLARLIGAQDIRSPTARDHVITTLQGMSDHWWEEQSRVEFKSGLEAAGIPFTDEDLDAAMEDLGRPTVDKSDWLDLISDLDRATAAVLSLGWILVRAPGGYEFLTNDVGLVKFAGGLQSPAPPTPGFNSGGTHWVVPLSPKRALAIAPGASRVVTSTSKMVKDTNRAIVETADRFVYSRLRSEFVEKWWSEAAGLARSDVS